MLRSSESCVDANGGRVARSADTSIIIDLFDRGNARLLEEILNRYEELFIPWIVLYEYLYGHKYLGRDITDRKRAVEKLDRVVGATQDIIVKALEIDIDLHKKGTPLPFSDILVAATAIVLKAELVTLDKRHYTRISGVKTIHTQTPQYP